MNRKLWKFAVLLSLVVAAVWAVPAGAQTQEVKEKPRMYSYVSFWTIPRSQWAEMRKADDADVPLLSKAVADGTLVGWGDDMNLVHQPDGTTHDEWWSSMSMAGLLNVLGQFYRNDSVSSPVLESATKHSDGIYVSRYYNWRSGSWKNIYGAGGSYKLKPEAPDNAVDLVGKNLVGPLLEKLLADGTIYEYEIDTEAVHKEAPGTFWIFYLAANADSVDKVNAAVRAAVKADPLGTAGFDSMIDWSEHRDFLDLTNATYK
jgi:hypothetical protein